MNITKPRVPYSTKSTSPKVTSIIPPKKYTVPKVFYTLEAYNKILYVIDKCTKEVGWFGLVDKEGDDYIITDIFIPKQTVSMTETDILPEDLIEIALQVPDPSKLLYWGHSHVNMAPIPSAQDEEQTFEYLNNVDMFIRGIYNKKGESKVDVFNVTDGVCFECVHNQPLINALSDDEIKVLDDTLTTNVKEQVIHYASKSSRYPSGWQGYYDDDAPTKGKIASKRLSNPFIVTQ